MRVEHRQALLELLGATRAFREEEIGVAMELFDETATHSSTSDELRAGEPTGYQFLGLFDAGAVSGIRTRTPHSALIGYVCYGRTPATQGTWDLYWIAVHPSTQGSGGGRMLLEEVERRVQLEGGRMIVVETSSRTDYESTRRFYDRRGYREGARVQGFYAPGDDRVIYTRQFSPEPVAGGASQQ
jgi:D-alanine-D-alanine ligase